MPWSYSDKAVGRVTYKIDHVAQVLDNVLSQILCPGRRIRQGHLGGRARSLRHRESQSRQHARRGWLRRPATWGMATGWPICFGKDLCWHQIQSSVIGLGSRINLQQNATSNLESTYLFPEADGPPCNTALCLIPKQIISLIYREETTQYCIHPKPICKTAICNIRLEFFYSISCYVGQQPPRN